MDSRGVVVLLLGVSLLFAGCADQFGGDAGDSGAVEEVTNGTESTPPPPTPVVEIDRVQLLDGNGTAIDPEEGIERGEELVVAVEGQVPSDEAGTWRGTVEVTVTRNDEEVASVTDYDRGHNTSDAGIASGTARFETESWQNGTHVVEARLIDRHTGNASTASRGFRFRREYSSAELDRLDVYEDWAKTIGRHVDERGLNHTGTDAEIDERSERAIVTVRLARNQELRPAAAETAHGIAVVAADTLAAREDPTVPETIQVEIADHHGTPVARYTADPGMAAQYMYRNTSRETYARDSIADLEFQQVIGSYDRAPPAYLRAAELRSFGLELSERLDEREFASDPLTDSHVDVDEDTIRLELHRDSGGIPSIAIPSEYVSTMLATYERNHPTSDGGVEYYYHQVTDDWSHFFPHGEMAPIADAPSDERTQMLFDLPTEFASGVVEYDDDDPLAPDELEEPFENDQIALDPPE